jgi:protein gp37
MANLSKIQWTDATWNIARGCTKVDADCKFCYMYRESYNSTRFDPLQVVRTKGAFNLPLRIKEPSRIFTCSLTDFFHESIDSYRHEAWDIIRKCPQHTFQILTKRPERISQCLPDDWGEGWDNVWLGTSIGSQQSLYRMFELVDSDWKKTQFFISLEPLHGAIKLPPLLLRYFWVIVGGESGNDTGKYRYRPCDLSWIESIIEQCRKAKAPVFVKQMGTHLAKEMGLKDRHGGDIDEWPEHLRIREFPIM